MSSARPFALTRIEGLRHVEFVHDDRAAILEMLLPLAWSAMDSAPCMRPVLPSAPRWSVVEADLMSRWSSRDNVPAGDAQRRASHRQDRLFPPPTGPPGHCTVALNAVYSLAAAPPPNPRRWGPKRRHVKHARQATPQMPRRTTVLLYSARRNASVPCRKSQSVSPGRLQGTACTASGGTTPHPPWSSLCILEAVHAFHITLDGVAEVRGRGSFDEGGGAICDGPFSGCCVY